MAYKKNLAGRIREKLIDLPIIEEKEMMGGLTFMVNDKMCIGIIKDEMMCRIDPSQKSNMVHSASQKWQCS